MDRKRNKQSRHNLIHVARKLRDRIKRFSVLGCYDKIVIDGHKFTQLQGILKCK